MADDFNLDDVDPEDYDDPVAVSKIRDFARQQEREAKAGRAAQRELALMKAGVDMSTKAGQLFAKAYDGKLDDIETIKSEWAEIAPAPPVASTPEQTPEVETPSPETQGTATTPAPEPPATPEPTGSAERQGLSAGVAPTGTPTGNRREQLLETAREARQLGDWDHAAGGLIHGIVEGFREGEIAALGRDGRRPGE